MIIRTHLQGDHMVYEISDAFNPDTFAALSQSLRRDLSDGQRTDYRHEATAEWLHMIADEVAAGRLVVAEVAYQQGDPGTRFTVTFAHEGPL